MQIGSPSFKNALNFLSLFCKSTNVFNFLLQLSCNFLQYRLFSFVPILYVLCVQSTPALFSICFAKLLGPLFQFWTRLFHLISFLSKTTSKFFCSFSFQMLLSFFHLYCCSSMPHSHMIQWKIQCILKFSVKCIYFVPSRCVPSSSIWILQLPAFF